MSYIKIVLWRITSVLHKVFRKKNNLHAKTDRVKRSTYLKWWTVLLFSAFSIFDFSVSINCLNSVTEGLDASAEIWTILTNIIYTWKLQWVSFKWIKIGTWTLTVASIPRVMNTYYVRYCMLHFNYRHHTNNMLRK